MHPWAFPFRCEMLGLSPQIFSTLSPLVVSTAQLPLDYFSESIIQMQNFSTPLRNTRQETRLGHAAAQKSEFNREILGPLTPSVLEWTN